MSTHTTGVDFAADLREVEADVPQTVTIAGQTVAATVSGVGAGYRVDSPEGWHADIALTATVRQSLLPAAPTQGGRLTFGGKAYRMVRVTPDDAGIDAAWLIECEEQSA